MALIRWEPFRNIEKLFEDDFPFLSTLSKIGWDLAVDVYEEKGNVVAEMNLPGIDADSVDITFEDGYLKISGTREEEKETKDKNYYCKEIKRGGFQRMVKLPTEVIPEKAEAQYKKGVLRVIIPKKETKKADRIKVTVK